MYKKLIVLLSLCVLVTFTLGTPPVKAEKSYINGIDFGFPPFGYVDKAGNPTGFDVECVNWIAKEMGFKVTHQPMDWDGIIPALNAKKIDLIASGMGATAPRMKIVNFTAPYYQVTQVILVMEDQKLDFAALLQSGKKIGTQRGTTNSNLLKAMQASGKYKFEITEYDSTDLSLEDLKIGRIAAAGMDSSIAYELKKDQPYKIVGTLEAPPENYAYAVRKGDKELLDMLNTGLKKLMADPQWKVLKAKYDIP
jgi:polar amino acid transport system substrate-binding protein